MHDEYILKFSASKTDYFTQNFDSHSCCMHNLGHHLCVFRAAIFVSSCHKQINFRWKNQDITLKISGNTYHISIIISWNFQINWLMSSLYFFKGNIKRKSWKKMINYLIHKYIQWLLSAIFEGEKIMKISWKFRKIFIMHQCKNPEIFSVLARFFH